MSDVIYDLYKLYDILLEDPESGIAPYNYCTLGVTHEVRFDTDGELVGIYDIRATKIIPKAKPANPKKQDKNKKKAKNSETEEPEKTKQIPRDMILPEQEIRSSNETANVLYDNAEYALGFIPEKKLAEKDKNKGVLHNNLFKERNIQIFEGVEDEGAKAFVKFLTKWDPSSLSENYKTSLKDSSNIVFRLDGDECFLHERPAIVNRWKEYCEEQLQQLPFGQCLITGENTNITRLHHKIKGVPGTHSTGGCLISHNQAAHESYGKGNGENAPVSKKVEIAYTTTLNYLISNPLYRIYMGDMVVVIWANEKQSEEEKGILTQMFSNVCKPAFKPTESAELTETTESEENTSDQEVCDLEMTSLYRLAGQGKTLPIDLDKINLNKSYSILGLSGNVGRVVVRFYEKHNLGEFIKRLQQFSKDVELVGFDDKKVDLMQILKGIAKDGNLDLLPKKAREDGLQSILFGWQYPSYYYHRALDRYYKDTKNAYMEYVRASFIKAYLLKHYRMTGQREELTVGLNSESTNTAYQLGRAFAVLQKLQKDALPDIKKTLYDTYFYMASTTPRSAFNILMTNVPHYVKKSEHGKYYEKMLTDIMDKVNEYPVVNNEFDKGQFIIGYHHQVKEIYTKKEKPDTNTEVQNTEKNNTEVKKG